MEENIKFEFSLTKTEAKKIFYGKIFRPQLVFKIIQLLLFIPALIIWDILLVAVIEVGFNVTNPVLNYSIVAIFSLIILYSLFFPLHKLYFNLKGSLDFIYDNTDKDTFSFNLDKRGFIFKNDYSTFETKWENCRKLKMDKDNLLLETFSPNIWFYLPINKINDDIITFLRANIKP